jgi:hypothetical protein
MQNDEKQVQVRGNGVFGDEESDTLESIVFYPDKDGVVCVSFDMNQLQRLSMANPVEFESIESAKFGPMYLQTFELDKDHIAYVLLPISFFKQSK